MAKKTEVRKAPTKILYKSLSVRDKKTGELVEIGEVIDVNRAQEFLDSNFGNRPRSSTLVKRYAMEIVRGKWKLNGEPWIVSKTGATLSAQHRAAAVVLAETIRQKDPEYYAENYGVKGPIKVNAVVIYGVDDAVADTIDQGKARSHGDVLFRMDLFDEFTMADKTTPEFRDGDKKKLAKDLATALRTVWLRCGGMKVSDAPKFPQSEMLDFYAEHPRILDCVVATYREDDGSEKRVSSLVSRAYMAAVVYLLGVSGTDRDKYDKTGVLDTKHMKDAIAFMEDFASGVEIEAGSPVLALRSFLVNMQAKRDSNRDTKLAALIKAATMYLDGTTGVKSKDLALKKDESFPRIGGLDIEIDDPVEEDPPAETEAKPAKAGKSTKSKSKTGKTKASAKAKPADEDPVDDEESSFEEGDLADDDDAGE